MKEEEIIWHEENWNRHKTGRKAESHRRVWKLTNDIWDEKFEGCMSSMNCRNCRCWKKKRKTHYLVKPVLAEKTRKPKEKEHWRYKVHMHTWAYNYQHRMRRRIRRLKEYDSYTWDTFYSALGFMEDNIKIQDTLLWEKGWSAAHFGYGGKKHVVRKKFYKDWGDRDTLQIEIEVVDKRYNYEYGWDERKVIDIWEFLKYYKQKVA